MSVTRSLRWKIAALTGGALLLLLFFLLSISYRDAHGRVYEAMEREVALALQFDLAVRDYVGHEMRPLVSKLVPEHAFDPRLMSTSYVAREVFERVQSSFPDHVLRFSSSNPRNPKNKAGPAELEVLARFEADPSLKEWQGKVELDGKDHIARFRVRRLTARCMRCHGDPKDAPPSLIAQYGASAGFGEKEGAIAGLDMVAVPTAALDAAILRDLYRHAAVFLVAVLAAGLLMFFVLRALITDRLARISRHMNRIAQAESPGHIEAIEDAGNDEIGRVADSFNRLAAKLEATYDRLGDDVQARTAALQEANDRLKEEAARHDRTSRFYRTCLDSMNDAVSIIDVNDYTIVGVNKVFLQQYGLTEQEALGRKCHVVTHGHKDICRLPHDPCPLVDTLQCRGHAHFEHVHVRADGTKAYVEVSTSPIVEADGEVRLAVHVARDVSDRKAAQDEIRHLAYYDRLTSLPNRVLFGDRLEHALSQARRYERRLALLFLDIDGFKRINDTMGQAVGDTLLVEVAARLRNCVRESDVLARTADETHQEENLARVGGDEFTILLTEVAGFADAARVARRVQEALQAPFSVGEREVYLTASIGIATWPSESQTASDLLRDAETALHSAKADGRDRFKYHAASMQVATLEKLTLEGSLRRALAAQEFVVHYQPQLDLRTRELVGFEALVRWKSPDAGLVSPATFIPLAEETGLIVPIGEWVLRTACAQTQLWRQALGRELRISVNLSAVQFRKLDIVGTIGRIVDETGLPASAVELEITESVVMADLSRTRRLLDELVARGFRLAMDDFGTGYSSLSYLKQFPFHTVKIDRSFVGDVTERHDAAVIAKAIVAMAEGLDLDVVAEGVETAEQLRFLIDLGCHAMQGYFLGRPMPVDEATEFLSEKHKLVVADLFALAGDA